MSLICKTASVDLSPWFARAREPEAVTVKVPDRAEIILGLPVMAEPWSKFIDVTPEIASALLGTMGVNRPISAVNVDRFVSLIRSGGMKTTHQGLAFDVNGKLIDGQHRLHAVIKSGLPIKVMATFGMDASTFDALDRGRARTVGDDLDISSIATGTDANVIAAACKAILHFDAGRLPWTTGMRLETSEALKIINRHPLLPTVAELVKSKQGGLRMPLSAIAAFFTLFYEVDSAKAEAFLDAVMVGNNLSEGDPAHAFRHQTLSDAQGKGFRTAANRNAAMVRIVRAWNATCEGRKVKSLAGMITHRKLANGTVVDQGFPDVFGYARKGS